MRKILIFGLLILLVGCKSRNLKSASSEKFIIENLAKIAEAGELEQTYPDAIVTAGTDMVQEGIGERPFSVLFPETQKEALITWRGNDKKEVYRIMVSKNGPWKTESGIEIGTTYEELVEINGGPVSIYGFGWDYSGAITWDGGKMEDSDIRIFVAPTGEAPNKFYGDDIISPTQAELDSLQLTVQTIIFRED